MLLLFISVSFNDSTAGLNLNLSFFSISIPQLKDILIG